MEITLAILIFISPITAFELFKVNYNADTAFLGYIIGWFCLLVSVLCIWAIVLLKKERQGYVMLINILGLFWIGIGLGIYLVYGRIENLFSDSLKGMILLLLNYNFTKTANLKSIQLN